MHCCLRDNTRPNRELGSVPDLLNPRSRLHRLLVSKLASLGIGNQLKPAAHSYALDILDVSRPHFVYSLVARDWIRLHNPLGKYPESSGGSVNTVPD